MDILQLKHDHDPQNMHAAIAGFPDQIKLLLGSISDWMPVNIPKRLSNVLICGMGGSAIGGDLLIALAGNHLRVPVFINRSYDIPAWVNEETLVLASSYSGNTEETLSAFQQVLQRKATCTVISTGGKLTELAKIAGCSLFSIPGGLQPRAALGYSVTALLVVLNRYNLLPDTIIRELSDNVQDLAEYSRQLYADHLENPALTIASKIHQKMPVIYGSTSQTEVAALRMRGQLAENGKILASHLAFPEQNHNEIEGWTCNDDLLQKIIIIWILDKGDHPQVIKRMEITADILSGKPYDHIYISVDGISRMNRLLKKIHLIDWISYYVGLLNEVDPTPVDRISLLKSKMSN